MQGADGYNPTKTSGEHNLFVLGPLCQFFFENIVAKPALGGRTVPKGKRLRCIPALFFLQGQHILN
jgi:hypothetical protein